MTSGGTGGITPEDPEAEDAVHHLLGELLPALDVGDDFGLVGIDLRIGLGLCCDARRTSCLCHRNLCRDLPSTP